MCCMRPLVLPDEFTDHGKPEKMYANAGLDRPASCHGLRRARPGAERGDGLSIATFALRAQSRIKNGMNAETTTRAGASTSCSSRAGYSPSRSRARDAILRGTVTVDGRVEAKPGRWSPRRR
jgi:hypothetical protein